jgi:hypothetical protein
VKREEWVNCVDPTTASIEGQNNKLVQLRAENLRLRALVGAPGGWTRTIELPAALVQDIENYLDADWSDGRDPSGVGVLNAVAYIGERVAALWLETRQRRIVFDGPCRVSDNDPTLK